jgi:hypothetical protein
MMRDAQRRLVLSPPAGTDPLELRFHVLIWSEEAQLITTVDLQ